MQVPTKNYNKICNNTLYNFYNVIDNDQYKIQNHIYYYSYVEN